MAQRVQITVEAKDAASGVLRGITSQFGQLGTLMEDLTASNVSWGNVAATATSLVIDGLKDSLKVTQEYAAQVRDLSLASGASAEESSRLLQVLDDFEISADDVTAATKALTKEGLAPTVETIAKLSDKYVTLNSAQDKNKFITENLGRGGLAWANALSQGGDALRSLNNDVSASLILTQENIDESEKYRLALDAWNDSVLALKISIGNGLLPLLTDMMTAGEVNSRAMKILEDNGNKYSLSQLRLGHVQEAGAAAALAQARAEMDVANAIKSADGVSNDEIATKEENLRLLKEQEAAIKAVSAANTEMLGLVETMQSSEESYNETIKKLAEERAALKANDIAGLEANTQKVQENEAAHELANRKIILGLIERKLTADGILDDNELNWLLEKGQAWGIYSANVVAESKKAMDEASNLAGTVAKVTPVAGAIASTISSAAGTSKTELKTVDESFLNTGDGGKAQLDRLQKSADSFSTSSMVNKINDVTEALNNIPTDIVVNVTQTDTTTTSQPGGRAAGGEVYAGQPYTVGENGAERFVPSQNGRILGKSESLHAAGLGAGGGANYFYGNVTLQVGEDVTGGLLGYR